MNAIPIKGLCCQLWRCKCGDVYAEKKDAEYCCSPEKKKAEEEAEIKKNGIDCGGDE